MPKTKCANCAYFVKGDEILGQGRCRRYPRQAVSRGSWFHTKVKWEFPLMDANDKCGAWEQSYKYCDYCESLQPHQKVFEVSSEKRICQECLEKEKNNAIESKPC